MITGIEVPLEAAALLSVLCIAAGIWVGQVRANKRLEPRRALPHSFVHDLLKSDTLHQTIDLTARRNAMRARSHAVLHGRIDRPGLARGPWGSRERDEMRDHIAAVLRAGLRREDRIALGMDDDFTITVPGADERAAINIAGRLRRRLAGMRLPQTPANADLYVNFGVAAAQSGYDAQRLGNRARMALRAAVARGADHIVPASEIEEIKLLPAPAPSPSGAASAA